MFTPTRARTLLARTSLAAAIGVTAACGSTATKAATRSAGPSTTAMGVDGSTPGMAMAETVPGRGLLTSYSGFSLQPLTAAAPAGQPSTYRFRIVQANGQPLTQYQVEQTKLLHLYLIRSDTTGFEHLHPVLGADGTWAVTLDPMVAGSYRVFVQCNADPGGKVTGLVLSRALTVTGPAAGDQPLPPATPTVTADGFVVNLSGHPHAGMASPLTISFSRAGQPVTDLQPYLDTYAHLTAIHEGDLAFAHLHPAGSVHGDHGGPTLDFDAVLPEAGAYRLFIQFQIAGVLHTVPVTIVAGS